MKKLFISIISIVLLAGLLAANSASADEVYSWKDGSGKKVYGSKPPKNASAKKPVGSRSYSTYSSNKLLKGYGVYGQKAELEDSLDLDPRYPGGGLAGNETAGLTESEKEDDGAEQVASLASDDKEEKSESRPEIVFQNTTGLNLNLEDTVIIHDKDNHIVSLSAQIKNLDKASLENIEVGFAFQNGSFAPALGPREIGPNQISDFKVTTDLLPIVIGSPPTRSYPVVVIKFVSE